LTAGDIKCPKCGGPVGGGRIEFRSFCEKCGIYLHACRFCAHFDPRGHHECRASATAEYVSDKEKFNFCEEFKCAGRPAEDPSLGSTSRSEIEKLFGGLP
jgi:hypothetical protein